MIYEKPKNEIFASDAKDGEIVEFPNIKRGWGVTENLGFIPPMEYFNAAFNRVDKALAYQMQRGVSEWSADEEYPVGALSVFNGTLYQAKTQNINKKPSENTSLWGVIVNEEWANTSFVKKEDIITKRLPAGDYNSWDFWRSIPDGTYWHIETDGSNSPTIWAFVEVVSYAAEKDVIWRIGGEVYMLHINHNKVPVQWDRLIMEREFQCSKAQNGYTKLPNGLILQWGSIAGGVAGERAFPIAFPNIVLAVIAGNADAQGAVVDNAFAYAISKEKFYYGTKSSYGGAVSCFPGSYIAIGC